MIHDINASIGIDTINNKPNVKNEKKTTLGNMQKFAADIHALRMVIDENEHICASLQQLMDKLSSKEKFEQYKNGLSEGGREFLTVKNEADGSEKYFSITSTQGNMITKVIPPGEKMEYIYFMEYMKDKKKALKEFKQYDTASVHIEKLQKQVTALMKKANFSDSEKESFEKKVKENTIVNMDFAYNAGKCFLSKATGECVVNALASHKSDNTVQEKEKDELARQETISKAKEVNEVKETKDFSAQFDSNDIENNRDGQDNTRSKVPFYSQYKLNPLVPSSPLPESPETSEKTIPPFSPISENKQSSRLNVSLKRQGNQARIDSEERNFLLMKRKHQEKINQEDGNKEIEIEIKIKKRKLEESK